MGHTSNWGIGEQDTIVAALARALEHSADRILLDFGGDTYTYGEVDRLTNRLAHSLAALGLERGRTIVTMLDNNIDAVLCWIAANKLGAISVPINTALRGEFLRHQVYDAGAAIVVCEPDYLERFVAVEEGTPEVRLILHRGAIPDHPASKTRIEAFDDHRGDDDSPVDALVTPSDLACLIYTSGTTGPSKGCMITFNYMCNLARLKLRGAGQTADDIVLTPLPLFHFNAVASGVTATVLTGGRIAFVPRFSVSGFWPEVERSGATIASILGSMGVLLANAADNDSMQRCFGQVHTVRGNPFGPELVETWRTRFGARHVGSMDYGLTEAAVVTSLAPGEYAIANPGSSGKRNDDFEVLIVDDDDREVPVGTAGEIIVRPTKPHVMFEGYWRRPEATATVMKNLWFHTGDIGKFDEDGFFYFVDRKKDYLRRRGENISSFEMEATFGSHPDVAEVAVHAVFSEFGEDDVKVTAVLHEDAAVSAEELCRWALDKVPYYAVPRYIEFRTQLPKNPQGRVLKYQLRDEGKTSSTWDIETSDIEIKKR